MFDGDFSFIQCQHPIKTRTEARDNIDALLENSGWVVQDKTAINWGEVRAVREYQTDVGPADYVLFVNRKPLGVIEAKREDEGHLMVEEQSTGYARGNSSTSTTTLYPML